MNFELSEKSVQKILLYFKAQKLLTFLKNIKLIHNIVDLLIKNEALLIKKKQLNQRLSF